MHIEMQKGLLDTSLEGDGDEVVVQDEEGQPVEEEVVVDELAEVGVVLSGVH